MPALISVLPHHAWTEQPRLEQLGKGTEVSLSSAEKTAGFCNTQGKACAPLVYFPPSFLVSNLAAFSRDFLGHQKNMQEELPSKRE